MALFAQLLAVYVLVLVACQIGAVAGFVRALRGKSAGASSPAFAPRAAVILSVRGPDPDLPVTLQKALQQDYPDYRLIIIVDSDKDPAWPFIQEVMQDELADRISVFTLEQPRFTCSLKCSALIEAVSKIGQEFEVIAFLDGDVAPHPSWLAELVRPLADQSVGCTTGNRWYLPAESNWGSLVRYFWNAGAVVQVWLNGIVWAGSMALRTETIRAIGLLDAWEQALSVDATVYRQLRDHRLRVQFVPSALMPNRESISLAQFTRWVQRQLIAAKSCGSGWRLVAAHALGLVGSQVCAVGALGYGLIREQPTTTRAAAFSLAAYWLCTIGCALTLELAARRRMAAHGEPTQWDAPQTWRRAVPAIVLTHFVYAYAICGAYVRNQVSWRGVEYKLHGRGRVLMLGYRPYGDGATRTETQSVV